MNALKAACFALVIAAAVAAFVVYPMLPETVPIHWDGAGEADGFGPAWQGAYIFPLIMAFVLLLFVAIPKIAVFKENLRAFERQYWGLGLTLELFFMVFYAVTLLPNFGFGFNLGVLFMVPISFLFIALGLLMPSFKRNFFVGIRTPWTIASDAVWEKTHRLGGRLFVAAGLVTLVASFVPGTSVLFVIAPVLVAVAVVFVYSFLEYRKSGERMI